MARSDGEGLVVGMYAPVTVSYKFPSGASVSLDMVTEYPFGDTVDITVDGSVGMTLSLRIPSWADGASMSVNGSTVQVKPGE